MKRGRLKEFGKSRRLSTQTATIDFRFPIAFYEAEHPSRRQTFVPLIYRTLLSISETNRVNYISMFKHIRSLIRTERRFRHIRSTSFSSSVTKKNVRGGIHLDNVQCRITVTRLRKWTTYRSRLPKKMGDNNQSTKHSES